MNPENERGPESPFLLGNKLKTIKEKIIEITSGHIDDQKDLFVVDVVIAGHEGSRKISVLIDGDQGVNISEYARISRKLSNDLEEMDLIKGKYVLEVSSPGVDYPLSSARQYQKNIDRMIKVKKTDGGIVKGKLLGVSENTIFIDREEKIKNKVVLEKEEIPFEKIDQTNVLVTF